MDKNVRVWFGQRKKLLLRAAIIGIALFVCLKLFMAYYALGWTFYGQECFPYRLWFIEKGVIPQKGEYVYFRNVKIEGKWARYSWVKRIAGVGGDTIEVRELGKWIKYSARVPVSLAEASGWRGKYQAFVPWFSKPLAVRAHVIVRSAAGESTVFPAFETDTTGKQLPLVKPGPIGKGKYFVAGDSPRSYDSRYWGTIDEKEIIGKAFPLF